MKEEEEKLVSQKRHLIHLGRVVPSTGYFNESCQAYGGCEYLGLCKSEHPQRWLGDFVTRVWDPRNPDREEN